MNKPEIISTIQQFLSSDFEVPVDKIIPTASLKETLNLDSLDYVDLVVSIETNFGFKVKPEDFQKMETFDDFYNYVELRIKEKQVA